MGLDSVEIVMEMEDEFGISIPDVHAERIYRVRDMVEYISSRLQIGRGSVCVRARAFFIFRRVMQAAVGVPRNSVRPNSSLSVVIPASKRTSIWHQLHEAGFLLPDLVRSRRTIICATLAVLVVATFLTIIVRFAFHWQMLITAVPLNLLVGAAIAQWMTRPLANEFPNACQLVRDAVLMHPLTHDEPAQSPLIDRNEVSLKVRSIIAEQMNLPFEDVTEDKLFLKDLGVG